MHELALCAALLERVAALATARAATVTRVRVGVGPLAGVEPELLRHAYPFAAAGTPAEGSQIDIEDLPVQVSCGECGAQTCAAPNRLLCGACGSARTRVASGDELLLLRVEMSVAEAAHV
jgi:hydrogenase nickel incorporation protein HypA/HybF